MTRRECVQSRGGLLTDFPARLKFNRHLIVGARLIDMSQTLVGDAPAIIARSQNRMIFLPHPNLGCCEFNDSAIVRFCKPRLIQACIGFGAAKVRLRKLRLNLNPRVEIVKREFIIM